MPLTASQGLQSPIEGVPLWIAKLKAERYSERTIHMYRYLATRYLDKDPDPTKLGIQQYLASRLEEVSPALVSNERKALASLFRFLHSEGLWPVNPLNGIRHVRVRYRERLCPDVEDVIKVLNGSCMRRRDAEKLRVLVLLLATTGLRITEAASLLRESFDPRALELRVRGKGDKWRTVPLLRQTAEALVGYARGRRSQSLLKEDRARLLLDGEEVVELDYPAMHPHILYAWEGRQCPEGFYERVADLCGCSRFVAKSIVLFAVNAPSYASLSSAVNLDKATETKANLGRAEPKPILYDELKRQGLEPRAVIAAISGAHPIIEKYIFSGSANRLMLTESDIVTSALLQLMGLGIPALPVHDSLIAPRRHKEEVRRVMEDAYRGHTGFGITVE